MRLDLLPSLILLVALAPGVAFGDGDKTGKSDKTKDGATDQAKVHLRVTIVHAEGSRDPAKDAKPVSDKALKAVAERLASLPFQRFRHLRTITACAGCGKLCAMRLGEGLVIELASTRNEEPEKSSDRGKPDEKSPGPEAGGDETPAKSDEKKPAKPAARLWQLKVRLIDSGEASPKEPQDGGAGKIEPGKVVGETLVKTVVRAVDGGTFVLVSPRRRADGSRRLYLVSIGSRSWSRSGDRSGN